ncbi:MAG: hypothetical protein ACLGIN_08640, partial [Candidatus Sericytochromatia bacterium]
ELIAKQFIVKTGDRHSFPHSRVREALYERLEAPERRLLHQRVGEYLEQITLEAPGPVVHQLAHHFAAGESPEKAYRYSLKAGDAAEAAGADALALAHWQRADLALEQLALPDQGERRVALWRRIGQNGMVLAPDAAIAALTRLVAALRSDPETPPIELGGTLSLLATALALKGQAKRSLEVAGEAAALAAGTDGATRAALETSLAMPLMVQGRIDEMLESVKAALPPLRDQDLSQAPFPVKLARVRVLGIQNAVVYQGYQPNAEVGEAAKAASAAIGDYTPLLTPSLFGLHAAWSGREAEAQRYVDETLRLCRQIGAPPYQMVLYLQPYMLWQRGDMASARVQVEKALAHSHLCQLTPIWHQALALHAQILLDVQELEAARAGFAALEALAEPEDLHLSLLMARIGLGRVALASGDHGLARRWLERALADSLAGPARNPRQALQARRALGELAIAERRYGEAETQLQAAIALAEDPALDLPIESAHAWRALGDRHKAAGDRAKAHQAWREAGRRYHALKNMHGLSAITRRLEGLTGKLPEPEREEAAVLQKWRFMGGGV